MGSVRYFLRAKHVLLSFGSINPVIHQDLNSTALRDVERLFFVIVYLCIPVAGFEAIFDIFQHDTMPSLWSRRHVTNHGEDWIS